LPEVPGARAGRLAGRAPCQAELLPVPYFHVVFTLPEPLAEIAFQNKAVVYAILFAAAAEAMTTLAANPHRLGAEIGFVAVLHSWGQALTHHPHLHCVVPGGGLSPDRTRWVAGRARFFLPVKPLARLFRRLFLERLKAAFDAGELAFFADLAALADPGAFAARLAALRRLDWVVYAKKPFGGPTQVLAYLGRYTHRVAIANSRLVALDQTHVAFSWKDYRHNGATKIMRLKPDEFIRRFLLHTLPDGFRRIRSFGFLANGHRATKLALCRSLLTQESGQPAPQKTAPTPDATSKDEVAAAPICPDCGGRMRFVSHIPSHRESAAQSHITGPMRHIMTPAMPTDPQGVISDRACFVSTTLDAASRLWLRHLSLYPARGARRIEARTTIASADSHTGHPDQSHPRPDRPPPRLMALARGSTIQYP
jgi:hypothetical protein